MFKRNIIALICLGAVFIFFIILLTYSIYGTTISITEENNSLVNFKNFAVSNLILIIIGSIFFIIGMFTIFLVFKNISCSEFEGVMNITDSEVAAILAAAAAPNANPGAFRRLIQLFNWKRHEDAGPAAAPAAAPVAGPAAGSTL
jgi:hypothetical protein